MRFTVFKTKVYISFLFLAFIGVFLLLDKTGLFMPMLFASIIHEVGHLFFMWILDCQPNEINLILGSVQIVSSVSNRSFNNILISFSGPLFNIVVFAILFLNYVVYKNDEYIVFAFTNLLLGTFNLLALKGLDGGNILFHIIENKYNENVAEKIVNIITLVIAVLIAVVALILSVNGKISISMYILSIYLILSVLLKF